MAVKLVSRGLSRLIGSGRRYLVKRRLKKFLVKHASQGSNYEHVSSQLGGALSSDKVRRLSHRLGVQNSIRKSKRFKTKVKTGLALAGVGAGVVAYKMGDAFLDKLAEREAEFVDKKARNKLKALKKKKAYHPVRRAR